MVKYLRCKSYNRHQNCSTISQWLMCAHYLVGTANTLFNANLQNQLLSKLDQKAKTKPQNFSKFVADKKALITIMFGQWNEATKTDISLEVTYNVDF